MPVTSHSQSIHGVKHFSRDESLLPTTVGVDSEVHDIRHMRERVIFITNTTDREVHVTLKSTPSGLVADGFPVGDAIVLTAGAKKFVAVEAYHTHIFATCVAQVGSVSSGDLTLAIRGQS